MSGAPERPFTIEPFDPDRHDRSSFTCGIDPVDNFLKRTANKLAKADNLRLFVMTSDAGEVAGFHAINAHSVDYGALPERYARSRPRHGSIPAGFIAMIGVDRRFQGRRLGGDLLIDALTRIERASLAIGIAVVLLDVLDCGNPELVQKRKRLYESYGFTALLSNPTRLYIPIATVRGLVEP